MAQAVPGAVGLVPPTFPVTMGIPPPGYGPPPFIRAGFNASQPPPGKLSYPPVLKSHLIIHFFLRIITLLLCRLYAGSADRCDLSNDM